MTTTPGTDITDLPILRHAATGHGTPGPGARDNSSSPGNGVGSGHVNGSRPRPPGSSKRSGGAQGSDLDWAQIRSFRRVAADRLADRLRDSDGVSEEHRRNVARQIVSELLDEHVRAAYQAGDQSITPDSQAAMEKAIFDALLGLGRLQPLVDDPELENIEVFGCEKVVTLDQYGRVEELPPVADSEEELREMVANLASHGGTTERTFTENSPILHLNLHGGHRLAAIGWLATQTVINIRRHRLINVTIDELVGEYHTLTPELAAFLCAAVQARRSILVAGEPNTGKTTLLRALTQVIDPGEKIATFETEHELHLDELRSSSIRRPIALAARPGSGEQGPDGRPVGEVTLDDLLEAALRLNLDRMLVGEIRGPEALPMLKVAQAGAGSLSTIHARNARDAIERLATCLLEAGPHITDVLAHRLLAHHVDLIVHIKLRANRGGDGQVKQRRYVDEVIALEPGERGMPAVTDVFTAGPNGVAMPGTPPPWIGELADHGYRPSQEWP
ncbi:CpaF family protein [Phytoactinopolyspora sp. XMNu-373]|uniref:CpaF family protein n=1 Tax=Phytoactinopolyspora mesophila TaxID=2650750 RepID=A0A7K3M174_9ACTN|nr:CpaF family protein [Phytoactinopolyspora mesophila]